ncbi:MAG: DUF488 domain-containing protein [bacterium]
MDEHLVCTTGHANRPLETFVDLLRGNGIERVLDERTVPQSRHNPQFNRDTLRTSLEAIQIGYTPMPGLGGLRHARADSPNAGWRNRSFRGYADYMQSPEFAESLHRLVELARTERCALMCAEAVPWRCHRSLIGDALLVRGFRVEDIIGPKARKPHVPTAFLMWRAVTSPIRRTLTRYDKPFPWTRFELGPLPGTARQRAVSEAAPTWLCRARKAWWARHAVSTATIDQERVPIDSIVIIVGGAAPNAAAEASPAPCRRSLQL